MLLLVRRADREAGNFVGLLTLLGQRRVFGISGSFGIPLWDIPVVPLWFDRGPWEQEHCSFVWGHLKNSIAFAGAGLVPFGHRTIYSHSRMDGFVWCFEMGSAAHDLSIERCC